MCVSLWVCVPACTCGSVRMYHYFLPQLFFVWKTGPSKHCTVQELCSRIYSRMLMHCKHLPARNSRVKQEALRSVALEERCVYICDYRFDLSPYAGPFVIQTKGGTLQILWRFAAHLSRVKRVALDSPQSTLPLRRSHVSHWEQFTSIGTYFRKPLIQTRDSLFCSRMFPFSKTSILKWCECTSRNFCYFIFSVSTAFQKVY